MRFEAALDATGHRLRPGSSAQRVYNLLHAQATDMLAYLAPFLQKVWDKGVDIAAGVITSVLATAVIALIGLLGWQAKLWLDLRADEKKQRQQHRIAQELESEKRRQEVRDQYERLHRERDSFASAVATQGRQGQAELWDRYLQWLQSNNLQHLPGNVHTYEMSGWSAVLRITTDVNVSVNASNMEKLIRNTELPSREP